MSKTSVELLLEDVLCFRAALEACHNDLNKTIFGKFPCGCCGSVSEILAAFLQDRGHGTFTYVCGENFDGSHIYSHAWLEREGCIVDITPDQFDHCSKKTIVTVDRCWHDHHFPNQTDQVFSGELPQELRTAYRIVQEKLGLVSE